MTGRPARDGDPPFEHDHVERPLSHNEAVALYAALGTYLAQHIFDPEPEPITLGTGHGGAEAARRRRLQR